MMKYGKTVMDNFFGFSYENQQKILDTLSSSLNEDDKNIKDSLESIFKPYIDEVKSLYELSDKGLRLKSFYVERIGKRNINSLNNFFNAKKYTTESDYKELYFASNGNYDYEAIKFIDRVFDVEYVEDEIEITNDFINEFNNATYEHKRNFITKLIFNYILTTHLPADYIPGVNVIEDEFNALVLAIFGNQVFKRYQMLEPSRKIDFLYRYKDDIEYYYKEQLKESQKDNKSKRLLKRNPQIKYCNR